MIRKLLLLGATGDLAQRFLFPAIASLHAAARLPEHFEIVGAARESLDDTTFRRFVAEGLAVHARNVDISAREAIVRAARYSEVDVSDEESVHRLLTDASGGAQGLALYLALPPGLFGPVITACNAAGVRNGRLALEKPFGEDLRTAQELNGLVEQAFGHADDPIVYRIDHVLGMPTVGNLIGLRLHDRLLGAVWNATHIEQVEILWEETLALEDRAAFYDGTGALKDVMQNHMMQILSLVVMEPPAPDLSDFHDRKVDALRQVKQLSVDEVRTRTQRGRYSAGRLADSGGADGREVPDYADEEGVDPERHTETFAEIQLDVESDRWTGTRFLLRAGKAMAERRKGVLIHFRRSSGASHPHANKLWIDIDGTYDLNLHLIGRALDDPRPAPVTLSGNPPTSELPPYAQVLLDFLTGGNSLSVRGDEAEEAWRVVSPVLDAWRKGLVPLEEYAAGSAGPRPLRR